MFSSGISITFIFWLFTAEDNTFSFTLFLANITFLFLPEIYMYAPEILQSGKYSVQLPRNY